MAAWLKKYWRYPTVAAVIGYLYLVYRLGVSCPFLTLTGLPCPGCGMTRAVLSLLRWPPDILAAARYNLTVFLLPLFLWLFLTGGRPRGNKRLGRYLLIGSAAIVAMGYVWRLIG